MAFYPKPPRMPLSASPRPARRNIRLTRRLVAAATTAWDDRAAMRPEDNDVGRAPICPFCGVTALPAETSNVLDSGFVCENTDCDAFGELVAES